VIGNGSAESLEANGPDPAVSFAKVRRP
jgi:hypothetical protein